MKKETKTLILEGKSYTAQVDVIEESDKENFIEISNS